MSIIRILIIAPFLLVSFSALADHGAEPQKTQDAVDETDHCNEIARALFGDSKNLKVEGIAGLILKQFHFDSRGNRGGFLHPWTGFFHCHYDSIKNKSLEEQRASLNQMGRNLRLLLRNESKELYLNFSILNAVESFRDQLQSVKEGKSLVRAFDEGFLKRDGVPEKTEKIFENLIIAQQEWAAEKFLNLAKNKRPPLEYVANADDLRAFRELTRDLKGLFALRASKHSEKGKELARAMIEENLKPPKQVPSKAGVSRKEILGALPPETSPEARARAEEFVNKAFSDSEKVPPSDEFGDDYWVKIFRLAFLEELKENQGLLDEKQKETLEVRLALAKKDIGPATANIEKRESAKRGSLLISYALGATAALLRDPPPHILQILDRLTEKFGPTRIPYLPVHSDADWRLDGRDTAGRSVVVQYALYKHEKDKTKLAARRENLKAALLNCKKHSSYLIAHLPNNYVHTGPNGIAPYYYYPSIPFALMGANALLRDSGLTKEEKEEVKIAKELLGEELRLLARKDGTMKPQGGLLYAASPLYVNPFAGLALVELLPEQKRNP